MSYFNVHFLLLFILNFSSCTDFKICPINFTKLGHKCYHFSDTKSTWSEAHFDCLLKNSSLVTILKAHQQHLLNKYLKTNKKALGEEERWIGGKFNVKKGHWIWAASGDLMKYNAFSETLALTSNEPFCSVLALNNRWNARNCLENKFYICQTKTNAYVEFKLTLKKNFNISKCGDLRILSELERKHCKKLLGDVEKEEPHPNEPAPIRRRNKPKTPEKNIVCTPNSFKLGNKCYIFSRNKLNFFDAYLDCKSNNSKLAILKTRKQDNVLRAFLNERFVGPQERWIGGMFDWKANNWKWSTGDVLKYKGFAKHVLRNRTLAFTGIIMDPNFQNHWNARLRSDEKFYICQLNKPRRIIKHNQGPKPEATIEIARKRHILT